jgi:hypothetical protein
LYAETGVKQKDMKLERVLFGERKVKSRKWKEEQVREVKVEYDQST